MREHRPLRTGEYIATCQNCGDWGIEDQADPAPGLCPTCFEKEMRAGFIAVYEAMGMSADEIAQILSDIDAEAVE